MQGNIRIQFLRKIKDFWNFDKLWDAILKIWRPERWLRIIKTNDVSSIQPYWKSWINSCKFNARHVINWSEIIVRKICGTASYNFIKNNKRLSVADLINSLVVESGRRVRK